MSSNALAYNTLMLDEKRVIVESEEIGMQKLFQKIGIKTLTVPMRHAYALGGGFHCYTSDIRRRGNLESYFAW